MWKIVNVKLLFKVDILVECVDFKGISIILVIVRVFECVVYKSFGKLFWSNILVLFNLCFD